MRALPAVLVGVVLLALAGACGGKGGSGPAWPKSAGRIEVDPEKDGGESLEPQHASHVAAVERAEDRTPVIEEAVEVKEPEPAEKPKDASAMEGEAKDKPASPPPPEGTIEVIEVRPEDIQIEK